MHAIQQKLYELIGLRGVRHFESLRDLGRFIDVPHPQKIKHHLLQLEKRGLVRIDWKKHNIALLRREEERRLLDLVSVPLLGAANCGPAALFAEERPEGMLMVSKKMLPRREKLFALRAVGDSMNSSDVNGATIDDGDFVIVDPEDRNPRNGDYVLSIIDNCANVKRYFTDENNHQILLKSESTANYPPIFIHESDNPDFFINGKVIWVLKNSQKCTSLTA